MDVALPDLSDTDDFELLDVDLLPPGQPDPADPSALRDYLLRSDLLLMASKCIRKCHRCCCWAPCCTHLMQKEDASPSPACTCDPWDAPLSSPSPTPRRGSSLIYACIGTACRRLLCCNCVIRVFVPNAGLEPQPMCRSCAPQVDWRCAGDPLWGRLTLALSAAPKGGDLGAKLRVALLPFYRMAASCAALFRPDVHSSADLLHEAWVCPPGTPNLPPFVPGAAYVAGPGPLLWDAHHFLPKAYLNGIPQAGKGEVEAVRPGETLLLESLGLGCTQQHVGALRLAGVRCGAGLGLDPIHRHALGERCRVVPFTCRHWSAGGEGCCPLSRALPQGGGDGGGGGGGLPANRMCDECAAMFAIPNACGQRRSLDTLDITIRCSQHVPAIATALLLLVVLRERLADEQVVGRVTLEEVQVYACPNPGCASAHALPQRSYTDIVTGALGYGPACPSCGNLAGFVDALGLPGVPHATTGKPLQAVDTPHVSVSVAGCLDVELADTEDVSALLHQHIGSVFAWYAARVRIATEGHAGQCKGGCLGMCSGAAAGGMVAAMAQQYQEVHS